MTPEELKADIVGWKRGRAQLLTKLRDEVEGLDRRIANVSLLEQYTVNREFVCLSEVLALIEKAGE